MNHITIRHCASRCCAAVIALGGATAAGAQAERPLESVLTYRTTKVADGIYAFVTPEERTGLQSGNSIVIVGDDGVLVFDTGNIPSSTRRQIAEIRKLTDKPVRYVVNSHWHPDHNLGNSEYRAAFPNAIFIGTSATRAGIQARVPGYFNEIRSFGPTDSLMKLRLSTGKMRDGSAMPNSVRVMWGLMTRDYGEFMPEVLSARAFAPETIFDDSLTLWLGQRQLKLVRPGRGNTEGDTFMFVPDASVVLTGDLVTVPCPFPSTSFFSDWIAALDRLKALKASTIVPGHGDVQHEYTYVELTRELLVFTREKARAAVLKGQTLEQLDKETDFSDFIKRFGGSDLVRNDAFNSFYAHVGLQRAYDEAKFMLQGPIQPGDKH
ncbi:MAG: MBL fold metallo-hydrolase [Gemmatimonadaceae bacterium]